MVKQIFNMSLSAILLLSSNVIAADVGTVIVTVKQVEIEKKSERRAAKRGSGFSQNESIVTGDEARARLKFVDGTLTTLGENTEFKVHRYQAEGHQPNARMELVKGAFRTITGSITKTDNPDFKVDTPVGSIGIRGTDFWGGYLQPDAVDILFIDGEHEIVVTNEYGSVILKKPGQGTTIKSGEAPSAAKVWPQEKVAKAVKTITIE